MPGEVLKLVHEVNRWEVLEGQEMSSRRLNSRQQLRAVLHSSLVSVQRRSIHLNYYRWS